MIHYTFRRTHGNYTGKLATPYLVQHWDGDEKIGEERRIYGSAGFFYLRKIYKKHPKREVRNEELQGVLKTDFEKMLQLEAVVRCTHEVFQAPFNEMMTVDEMILEVSRRLGLGTQQPAPLRRRSAPRSA